MGFFQSRCQVIVGGRDVTSLFEPVLEQIVVEDKAGLTSDTCEITLADVDGTVVMPGKDSAITVSLGRGAAVGLTFTGFVDRVTSTGAKGSGRELRIHGVSARAKSAAKQPMEKHADDKSFADAARLFGSAAGGLAVMVDAALGGVMRKYWSLDNESFMHWGQRIARELGATFKIVADKAVFLKRGAGLSAGGLALGSIRAVWGDNLVNWSITPAIGRPQFRKVRIRYYDFKDAKWKVKDVGIDGADATAELTRRFQAGDADQAKAGADGEKAAGEAAKGAGSVTILGDAAAKPEGTVMVAGTRPGIDGQYSIEQVTHRYDKKNGFTSELSLQSPKGAAGVDGR